MISQYLINFKNLKEKVSHLSFVPLGILILCFISFVGLEWIGLEKSYKDFIHQTLLFLMSYALIHISYQFLDLLESYINHVLETSKPKDFLHAYIISYVKKILKVFIVLFTLLLLLQSAGFNVTSILASLGIGGLALALGAKDTLNNLFGGVTILFDRPFSVGDWIVCNSIEGTVENIGFRSTKVKTFYDSSITIPNSLVVNSVVDNVGRRKARRTRFNLDITYDTSPEEIEAFVEGVKNILRSNPNVKQDYFQVFFHAYGPHSLQILVNFFLKVKNWDEELFQKQNIFIEILRLSQQLNISFAFPTQTLDIPHIPKEATSKTHLSPEELKKKASLFGPKQTLSKPQGLGIFTPPFKEEE